MRNALLAAALVSTTPILPPEIPWEGKSLALVAGSSDPWITPTETSGFSRTPRYDETIAYLRRLAAAAPEIQMVSLGKSPEGRDIWMAVVSRERAATPESLKAAGKPVLLAQAGIHAGEIDGKDAGLMLLRDLTVRGTKRALLEKASFLFVPIYNVDGHERFSPHGRINQRGPQETGWRTTAENLNLNRDYSKLDAPETQAMVRALNAWDPDLYMDLHVTDGLDYQYDITFGWNGPHAWSPSIARWLDSALRPAVTRDLEAMGHIPGPLILGVAEDSAPEKGIVDATGGVRFSVSYGDARHLPSVLVENHSLKPYRQRVLGTYLLLESALGLLGRDAQNLRAAITSDRARRPSELPLDWKFREGKPDTIELKGIEFRRVPSPISGADRVEWTGKRVPQRLLFHRMEPKAKASRPAAYWIPASAHEVIERLLLHGLRVDRLTAPREVDVAMYRLSDSKLATDPFEGHVAVTAKASLEKRRERFAPGSVRVPTDQPLGDLAMLLLEPACPDSFFQWGFFLTSLQPTEYVEGYIMEPMAERMLAEDPALRAEFEKKLREEPKFAADPKERLQWFYRKTPFFDERWNLYPVARE